MLRLQGRTLQFQLAGGPDPATLRSNCEIGAAQGRRLDLVDWLGHVDDMPALFADADVVVLPSYHEGLPKA